MSTSAEELATTIASVLSDTELSAAEKNARIGRLLPQVSQNSPAEAKPVQTNGASELNAQEKFDLITHNLQETLSRDVIQEILQKNERPLRIYWGTATTGRPHCGYFVPMIQIASFLRAGCHVTILLADLHGFLDNVHTVEFEVVKNRAEYYKFSITELLKAVGVSVDRLEFVLGSSYQLTQKYQMDLLKLCTLVTMHDARKAGSEVVKATNENATLSGLIYPLMQSLDEEYLGVDVQFGGVDQRKIFTLATEILPKVNYKKRAHLMNPMVPGLAGGKMSASDPDSKIDILDKPEVVTKKISKAFCEKMKLEENGLIAFVEHVLLPASVLKTGKTQITVEMQDGTPKIYDNIEDIRKDYKSDTITPQILKKMVSDRLNGLLSPIRAAYDASPEWQRITDEAYPADKPKVKPKKTPKNKGSRYPGGSPASVQSQAEGSTEGRERDQENLARGVTESMQKLATARNEDEDEES